MFDEYEIYQGVALRQIIGGAKSAVCLSPFRKRGRVSAFVLNGTIGVFVKHSSKRMSPWHFTFHRQHVLDLKKLEAACRGSYMIFVCGFDGLVAIDASCLHELVSFEETEQAWVRIERKPRSMYGLSGNRADLKHKLAHGAAPIHAALRN